MKISDSFVWLKSQSRQQVNEADWQTLSDSGPPPRTVNLLNTGQTFQDFLTGQLDTSAELQTPTSSAIPVNFASDEAMRLVGELAGHRQGFPSLDQLSSVSQVRSSTFRIQHTYQSFRSNYHFFSHSGNGLFLGSQLWDGSYSVRFQQPREAVALSTADFSAAGSRVGGRTNPSSQIVRQDSWHFRQDSQELQFAAFGTVATEDGRNITFNMDQTYDQSVSVLSGATSYFTPRPLIDPLVLDLNGQGVGFSNETIDFDLDGDGVFDSFSCLEDGCGFLAYDSNSDGYVTSGLELFGIASGNGFADLAAYDQDGNCWIDENDAIYNDLSIWTPTADGTSLLQSLQDADVGAICLADVDSSFEIVGDDGELQGQISGSGVYLTESGSAQAVHQVDIAVHQQKDEENLSTQTEEASSENGEEIGVVVA